MATKSFAIETPRGPVSAAVSSPSDPEAVLALAHGAGSRMDHPFNTGIAEALLANRIACLRFNFPYAESGRKSPDPPAVLEETWRAAAGEASRVAGALWVGGKSMGGRIGSMAVAEGMQARGIVFFGYPLHPPGKPEKLRVEHLHRIEVPMLFIQGTADTLARWGLLVDAVDRLGDRALLHPIEGGDHSFRVRGHKRGDAEIGRDLGEVAAAFISKNL